SATGLLQDELPGVGAVGVLPAATDDLPDPGDAGVLPRHDPGEPGGPAGLVEETAGDRGAGLRQVVPQQPGQLVGLGRAGLDGVEEQVAGQGLVVDPAA